MSVKRAIAAVQKLYPQKFSESAWDNTGLLVPPAPHALTASTTPLRILLTIDLTRAVVAEALSHKVQLIIAYHPFLFRKFNQLDTTNTQHESLMELIRAGIAVYSPHTAVDAVRHGVNDWLIEGVTDVKNVRNIDVISPNKEDETVGCGRLVELKSAEKLDTVIERLKTHLGVKDLLVASTNKEYGNVSVINVAICAGSGGSVFSNVNDVDLYVTGELSHHEGLAFKEQGKIVLLANHSNTERGYLKQMRELLIEELNDVSTQVIISEEDEDVYDFV